MTVDPLQAAFPQLNLPFVDEGRFIHRAWLELLIQLYRRTGSGGGGSTVTFPITVAQGGTDATNADSARANLGALGQNLEEIYGVTAGSANAQTLNLSPAIAGYQDGERWLGKIGVGPNTGSATINVNGKGAIAITDIYGGPLVGGELQSGALCEFAYLGGSAILLQTALWLGENFVWNKAIANGDAQCDFDPLPAFQKFTLNLDRVRTQTAGTDVQLLVKVSGSFVTANYTSEGFDASGGAVNSVATAADAKFILGANVGNTDAESLSGEITLFRPSQTSSPKIMDIKTWYKDNGAAVHLRDIAGVNTGSNAAVTGLRVKGNGVNLGGGTATLVGSRFS